MRRKQNERFEAEGGVGKLSVKDMETEMMPSMWPVDLHHNYMKQFTMGRREADKELLEEASPLNTSCLVDFDRLVDLVKLSEKGLGQLTSLAKLWELTQANAFRLLTEHLDALNQKRLEADLKHQQILEELINDKIEDKRSVAILEDSDNFTKALGSSEVNVLLKSSSQLLGEGSDSLEFWKNRARQLDRLLSESLQREETLMKRLQETSKEKVRVPPVRELQQQLLRADNFLHFILKDAPVVVAHQDKELRYRFIFNHFPILNEEDIIGKRDDEIFHGLGVQELMEFKREVIEKRLPMKRELSFDTDLIGKMTFLIAAEPVFNKKGETIGLNYVGFDISDQVSKMEKLAKLREEIAVQKAMETELHKTIHITEETMRAKQLLATMSHEIRSPLSGVLSMAEILATTKLDSEQEQLVDIMLSSGDLVLQLINDILDLSKVESGAMKLESTKFRPREVVKHVLQMATASLQNRKLVLEAVVSDEVPEEIVGDVLRIRQIFTNLVSNAIKFTHEGSVGIILWATFSPTKDDMKQSVPNFLWQKNCRKDQAEVLISQSPQSQKMGGTNGKTVSDDKKSKQSSSIKLEVPLADTKSLAETAISPENIASNCTRVDQRTHNPEEADTIWLHCDVCDTGIGIPENSLPKLFNEYMQVSTTHAREYGGTGLGLAICKQLVELMGGTMTVSSKENVGSKFSFILPCKAAKKKEIEVQFTEEWLQKLSRGEKKMIGHCEPSERTGYFLFNGSTLDCTACKPLIHIKNLPCKYETSSTYSHSITGDMSFHFDEDKASGDNVCISKCHSDCQKAGTEQSTGEGSGLKCTGNSLSRDLHLENLSVRANRKEKTFFSNERHKEILVTNESTTALPNDCCDGNKALEPFNTDNISMEVTSERSWMSRKPKILLVEDNSVNVMVARSMMKRLGHSLDVVGNGAEALQALQRNNYDLILMDVCMPVMDGFEATRRIRHFEGTGRWEMDKGGTTNNASTTTPSENFHSYTHNVQDATKRNPKQRIPIIAMTANALADNVAECFAQGMDSFIAKPVTFQTLAKVINQYIPGLSQGHADCL